MASNGSAVFSLISNIMLPAYNFSASSNYNWTEIYTYMRSLEEERS